MKSLWYSDLHLKEDRLDECRHVLRKVKEIAIAEKVDFIGNGGDTFNTRGLIHTTCFDILQAEYQEWYKAGLKQTILIGNHDQEDREGQVHPMKVFNAFDGWRVVDQPVVDQKNKTIFFPHMHKAKIESYLKSLKLKGKWDAFVHWGVEGAHRNDKNIDDTGVPLSWLSCFNRVFSGHYHYRNAVGNVQYIGDPYQQNFSEIGQPKGVMLITDKSWKFIEIEGTPVYHDVKIYWDGDKKRITKPKNIKPIDHVRVKIEGDFERANSVTKESVARVIKCGSIQMNRNVTEKAVARMNIDTKEIHNTESIMKKYVDFVDTTLDKKRLVKVGKELLSGLHG